MSESTAFDDPWYHKFINQTVERIRVQAPSDGHAVAMGILFGTAMIAQAVDNAFGERTTESGSRDGNGTTRELLIEIAAGINTIADELEERSR